MSPCHRRRFLGTAAGGVLLSSGLPRVFATPARAAVAAPTAPVSIGRCRQYDPAAILATLETMMDGIGGIRDLVGGKTVAVKVNLVGNPRQGTAGLPSGRTYQVNFAMVEAVGALLGRAGAKRVRFLESSHQTRPFEEFLLGAGWDLKTLERLEVPVELEDTRYLGRGAKYHELKVPGGGLLFPAYHVNHAYVDCDVYVSLAKLKNHAAAGVTLGMKNNFGVTPIALYGQHEPDEQTTNSRAMFHDGKDRPADGLPQELHPDSPRRATYRVPRHTVDAAMMRPIDLTIIDGIESVSGGEGPWVGTLTPQKAGVLIAGRNVVCTDAIATAVMGYDPMSAPATGPFPGDNHLALAAAAGLGSNDPRQIEVRGVPLADARHAYGWEPARRNT
jgi:uncharacterized protein (DUF362 family)